MIWPFCAESTIKPQPTNHELFIMQYLCEKMFTVMIMRIKSNGDRFIAAFAVIFDTTDYCTVVFMQLMLKSLVCFNICQQWFTQDFCQLSNNDGLIINFYRHISLQQQQHPFNSPLSSITRVSRYKKGKTMWIYWRKRQ